MYLWYFYNSDVISTCKHLMIVIQYQNGDRLLQV